MRILSFAILGALAVTGIGFVASQMTRSGYRGTLPPNIRWGNATGASTMPGAINTPIKSFEWKVLTLPPAPEDKILNALEETVEVEWNGVPLEQALAELLEPIALDYRGYITNRAMSSEFDTVVDLQSRASRKQILQRLLEPRQLGYIVHPSRIEIADMEYVRGHPTMRRYLLSHVCKTNLEGAEIVRVLQRMLSSNELESIPMTLNGPILMVRATESVHDQITQLLAALAVAAQP